MILQVSELEDSDFVLLEGLKSSLFTHMADMFTNIPREALNQIPNYDVIKHLKIVNAFTKINKLLDKGKDMSWNTNFSPSICVPEKNQIEAQFEEQPPSIRKQANFSFSPNDKHYNRSHYSVRDDSEDESVFETSRVEVNKPSYSSEPSTSSVPIKPFSFKQINNQSDSISASPLNTTLPQSTDSSKKGLCSNKTKKNCEAINNESPMPCGDSFFDVSFSQMTPTVKPQSLSLMKSPASRQFSVGIKKAAASTPSSNVRPIGGGRSSPAIQSSTSKTAAKKGKKTVNNE